MIRTLRPRRNRRFACPSDIKRAACEEILKDVWQLEWRPEHAPHTVPPNPYIDHWKNCVQEADLPGLYLNHQKIAVRLVNIVKLGLQRSIPVLKQDMEGDHCDQDQLSIRISPKDAGAALAFAIHLWLHVRPDIDWENPPSTALQDIIQRCVPKRAPSTTDIQGRLPNDFCAKHLWRKGGLDICWTDDLSKHLLLDGNQIHVFRYSNSLSVLHHSPQTDPFPPGLVSETLETLNLLYRPLDVKMHKRNRRLMDKYLKTDLEFAMVQQAPLDLKHYPYWHERLRAIQDAYDSSTPRNLRQWWFNRRDRVTWATFWLAFLVFVLTVLFGVIQSVTGIMQVYVAYHPKQS